MAVMTDKQGAPETRQAQTKRDELANDWREP